MIDKQVAIELKSAILAQLSKGKTNAVTAGVISKRLQLGKNGDRLVRLVIRELIADFRPIAATGKGFFITETQQEAEEYMATLKSRLVEDAYRRRDYKLAVRPILAPEQLTLFRRQGDNKGDCP